MSERLAAALRAALPALELREHEPLRAYTSLRIGGPARLLARPGDDGELEALCRLLRELGERPTLLGNGSNVLAPDEGLDGVVIVTTRCAALREAEGMLQGSCGVSLTRAAAFAARQGLAGLEFAYGIPGTLGGALVMNAGAYGGEMADCVAWTEYLDEDLRLRHISLEEHGFGYRRSAFAAGDVILRTCLRLKPGEREQSQARCRELLEKRRASQPLEFPSAGSAFKRPAGGYAAALIDRAGLKGYTVGGAQVSEKHAGFVVNRGGATAADMKRILADVRERVWRETGITLETEIRIL